MNTMLINQGLLFAFSNLLPLSLAVNCWVVQKEQRNTYVMVSSKQTVCDGAYCVSMQGIVFKSSNLDWPDLEKHSLRHSFIIAPEQSYGVFPNSSRSELLDFTIWQWPFMCIVQFQVNHRLILNNNQTFIEKIHWNLKFLGKFHSDDSPQPKPTSVKGCYSGATPPNGTWLYFSDNLKLYFCNATDNCTNKEVRRVGKLR